jgi:mannose-6-phosphate isomerase-like protein (cupin superfamily)
MVTACGIDQPNVRQKHEVKIMRRIKQKENESSFSPDINRITIDNCSYLKVLYTGHYSQLLVMSIPPGGETGEGRQNHADKMLFIVKGKAESSLNQRVRHVGKHDVIFLPAGSLHNLKNVGRHDLKLFAIYSPPLYAEGTLETQEDAAAARFKQFAYAWEQ